MKIYLKTHVAQEKRLQKARAEENCIAEPRRASAKDEKFLLKFFRSGNKVSTRRIKNKIHASGH